MNITLFKSEQFGYLVTNKNGLEINIDLHVLYSYITEWGTYHWKNMFSLTVETKQKNNKLLNGQKRNIQWNW